MNAAAPLFAAGIDWLEGLLPLVFVVFWIISQVVNVVRRLAGDGGRAQGRPAAPPPRRQPPAGQPDDIRTTLEKQIEEFLRQSAQRPPEPPRVAKRSVKQPAKQPQRPAASATSRAPASSTASSAAPSARRPLQPLGAAGDDVEEHVRDAFAHDLGHRGSSLSASRPTPDGDHGRQTMASGELASALRDPATLRRLVLMREILERPVERWE